jgi:hypothetical protein
MLCSGKITGYVTAGLAACAAAIVLADESADNSPYHSIVERNLFSLRPIPPAPGPPETPKPPAAEITLSGISTIHGHKRALLKTGPIPGKVGDAAKPQSFILSEGEREGDMEVTSIDEKVSCVKIIYDGIESTLTFTNTSKGAVAGSGAGMPTLPGLPGIPTPPGFPPVSRPGIAPPGVTPFTMPQRQTRIPPPSVNPTPMASMPGMTAAVSMTGGVAPGVRVVPVLPPGVQSANLSMDEQEVLIEAQRAAGEEHSAILPPTSLGSQLEEENAAAAQQAPPGQMPQ